MGTASGVPPNNRVRPRPLRDAPLHVENQGAFISRNLELFDVVEPLLLALCGEYRADVHEDAIALHADSWWKATTKRAKRRTGKAHQASRAGQLQHERRIGRELRLALDRDGHVDRGQ